MYASRRSEQVEQMLRAIAEDARLTASLTGRSTFSDRVMAAMREVPRDAFVPDELRDSAFENRPLPIGYGQTISQPYIVALMSDLLDPQPSDTILEIGTGCGYQSAILACLAREVFTVEIVPALQLATEQRLRTLGYGNITTHLGDGNEGWPEHAPYHGIIVTAACPEVPSTLVEQLKPGGRLVVPRGHPHHSQTLELVEKHNDGTATVHSVLPVAFVPMTGDVP